MITTFLAYVMGWFLCIIGLLFICRTEVVRNAMANALTQPGLFFFMALITLIIGLLLVMSHSEWFFAWPIVITVLSWLILLSSLLRLFYPETAIGMMQSLTSTPTKVRVVGLICLVLGIFLLANVFYMNYYVMAG